MSSPLRHQSLNRRLGHRRRLYVSARRLGSCRDKKLQEIEWAEERKTLAGGTAPRRGAHRQEEEVAFCMRLKQHGMGDEGASCRDVKG